MPSKGCGDPHAAQILAREKEACESEIALALFATDMHQQLYKHRGTATTTQACGESKHYYQLTLSRKFSILPWAKGGVCLCIQGAGSFKEISWKCRNAQGFQKIKKFFFTHFFCFF